MCDHDAKPPICAGHELKGFSCPEPECEFWTLSLRGLRQHRVHRKTWVKELNHE